MPENDKKPEDDIFAHIRQTFSEAAQETKEMAFDGFSTLKQGASSAFDNALRGAHAVESAISDGYKIVEDKVGRDRIIGASVGAKAGALISLKAATLIIPGVTVGVLIGSGIGFFGSRALLNRYRKVNNIGEESNDNPSKDDQAVQPLARKPGGMEP